jgi:transcriptional regulator with XRE-family HTH domain
MSRKTAPLLPATDESLRQFGDRLRLARLRRRLSAKQVAERAGMNPMTLRSLERGGSGVTIGAYLAVMQVLGVEKDLDFLAQADEQGRSLQDARLIQSEVTPRELPVVVHPVARKRRATDSALPKPLNEDKFVNSRDLVDLLSGSRPKPKPETKRKQVSTSRAPSSRGGRR